MVLLRQNTQKILDFLYYGFDNITAITLIIVLLLGQIYLYIHFKEYIKYEYENLIPF